MAKAHPRMFGQNHPDFIIQAGILEDLESQVKEAVGDHDFASVETYFRWYGDYLTMKPGALYSITADGQPGSATQKEPTDPTPIWRGIREFSTVDEKVRHLPSKIPA